ncbi:SMP-30/gluconolactonase/LRE family protein [Colwellia sp. 1_MG-2023]|uniref:SMP-30/gluconolactonase/LRE family protein n=1 Tax=unclassified Colwellia TaxID=196834 RepID=UPI001C0A07ED|nr:MULTISPECIES: SMP-30/gluconolactonase/LRE family protein [unclassified Colwellia]MBU2924280.1 SMP-30/gluconolactonase/LRE family protein [Colwellia sp. C2M11]MDO6652989.1 SMP-30/gluconolactonase/LRE family protein [Colwellia sp. 3_MG-2023]MDO6665471.1 SMP-30/gluconolactonase/LRE family protein [Colwellia sp. 2_MG-2023]MDO6689770.1 SMP-30/gluconolactonase/LRE family protein [Colwellia sp. 1_MG-2023]
MKSNKLNKFKFSLLTTLLFTGMYGCSANMSKTEVATEIKNNGKATQLGSAKLFATLPNSCPTPDGLAIAPDGSLTLACTNYANKGNKPGILLSISPNGDIATIGETQGAKKGGKGRPMGIAYAPDGSLYVCDSGRILRLTFKGGKIATTEVVARGLTQANGIRIHNGSVYVSLLQMKKIKSKNLTSGIYQFSLNDRNIAVTSTEQDKQLLFKTETKNPDRQFGLDGLVFDKKGYLYTGNFGDGEIYRLTLSPDGKKVIEQEIYAQLPKDTGLDGITIDDSGNLYVAGFLKNQIIKVATDRTATVLAQYPDNNGSHGELDQPSEVIVYGDKLIVSNFDLMGGKGIVNSKHSAPYTLSYLDLNN